MIELTDVTTRYGSTVAVDDLSFQVRPGEVTGFAVLLSYGLPTLTVGGALLARRDA